MENTHVFSCGMLVLTIQLFHFCAVSLKIVYPSKNCEIFLKFPITT